MMLGRVSDTGFWSWDRNEYCLGEWVEKAALLLFARGYDVGTPMRRYVHLLSWLFQFPAASTERQDLRFHREGLRIDRKERVE